jgi:hypothetical protein
VPGLRDDVGRPSRRSAGDDGPAGAAAEEHALAGERPGAGEVAGPVACRDADRRRRARLPQALGDVRREVAELAGGQAGDEHAPQPVVQAAQGRRPARDPSQDSGDLAQRPRGARRAGVDGEDGGGVPEGRRAILLLPDEQLPGPAVRHLRDVVEQRPHRARVLGAAGRDLLDLLREQRSEHLGVVRQGLRVDRMLPRQAVLADGDDDPDQRAVRRVHPRAGGPECPALRGDLLDRERQQVGRAAVAGLVGVPVVRARRRRQGGERAAEDPHDEDVVDAEELPQRVRGDLEGGTDPRRGRRAGCRRRRRGGGAGGYAGRPGPGSSAPRAEDVANRDS